MNKHNTLNYWLQLNNNFVFVGFARIVDTAGAGMDVGGEYVIPLQVGMPGSDWGDGEHPSARFPCVLLAKGIDDRSYYMLFGNKKAALEFAEEHMRYDGTIIDPFNETYHGRKWQEQN